MKTLVIPDYNAIKVRNFVQERAGIGRSSDEYLKTGRHEKAHVRLPCNWLAEIYGASQT